MTDSSVQLERIIVDITRKYDFTKVSFDPFDRPGIVPALSYFSFLDSVYTIPKHPEFILFGPAYVEWLEKSYQNNSELTKKIIKENCIHERAHHRAPVRIGLSKKIKKLLSPTFKAEYEKWEESQAKLGSLCLGDSNYIDRLVIQLKNGQWEKESQKNFTEFMNTYYPWIRPSLLPILREKLTEH